MHFPCIVACAPDDVDLNTCVCCHLFARGICLPFHRCQASSSELQAVHLPFWLPCGQSPYSLQMKLVELSHVAASINGSVNSSTGKMPHYILYGFEKHLPYDVVVHSLVSLYSLYDYSQLQFHCFQTIHGFVREKTKGFMRRDITETLHLRYSCPSWCWWLSWKEHLNVHVSSPLNSLVLYL